VSLAGDVVCRVVSHLRRVPRQRMAAGDAGL